MQIKKLVLSSKPVDIISIGIHRSNSVQKLTIHSDAWSHSPLLGQVAGFMDPPLEGVKDLRKQMAQMLAPSAKIAGVRLQCWFTDPVASTIPTSDH
ncbi:Vascular Endothelial Growth Factor Receptor 1 [Manis pentadactyla]|nr:Vascular Endothelial Growth Factor Receptor 1 [Manis pentadactyla]